MYVHASEEILIQAARGDKVDGLEAVFRKDQRKKKD